MTTEQNPLKILSAKILKGKDEDPDDVKIGYEEHFKDGSKSKSKSPIEFNRQPHPDFKEALKALRVHLAILCDQIDISQTNDEKLIETFHVNGFHITGDKHKGFVITGEKDGSYGRVGLNTRNFLFESKTMLEEYPLSEICITAIKKAAEEAALYIRGKHLPDPQGNLFDQASTVQVDKPVMFAEGESDTADLYGKEPAEVLETLASKEKPSFKSTGIPQADPEAMKRVMENPSNTGGGSSPESIVAGLEADANIKTTSKRKVKQTAENKSGEVSD